MCFASRMRYIHPYCALSARSIYENIVYGMQDPPGPESQEFVAVCKQAQAWDFINTFPNKQYVSYGEGMRRVRIMFTCSLPRRHVRSYTYSDTPYWALTAASSCRAANSNAWPSRA